MILGYNTQSDKDLIKLVNLSGVFVKKEVEEEEINGEILYPFEIIMQSSKKIFYAKTQEDREVWIEALQEAIGYSNLFNFYDIKGLLGKGSFAEVRAAVHRFAKKNVAVKILKKNSMTERQIERARSEIETLKICQHIHIMQLYEVFENADYIYLVLEYLNGGNLFEYFNERKFTLPEPTVCKWIYSIALAIDYMHAYGIVHRDIKLDNIVLANTNDNSEVKIVDFGLAKIFTPGELCDDPVGTLCYAAPEILLGHKYDKKVDIWSLGILTFFLLSGKFPFTDMQSEKEIARYR